MVVRSRRFVLKIRRRRPVRKTRVVVSRRKKRMVSVYKRPHHFYRTLDWSELFLNQGATFNGSFGLAAQVSAGVTLVFNGGLMYITVPAASLGYVSLALSPMMQSLPDYAEFTSLFDMYKIRGFSTKLYGMYNNYQAGTVSTAAVQTLGQTMPLVHTCMDWDDNTPFTPSPAGLDAIREFLTYKWRILNGNNVYKLYCSKPGVKIVTGTGDDDSGRHVPTFVKRSPMLDCHEIDVQHHAQKLFIEVPNLLATTPAAYVFKLETKVWLTLFQPR